MIDYTDPKTGLKFALRENSSDRMVIHEVIDRNDYKLDPAAVKDYRLVTDIGANCGAFTLYAAVLCPFARIIAYEPEPSNQAALERNIALNGFGDRISVHGCAVSDRRGTDTITKQCGNSRLGQTLIKENPGVPADVLKAVCTVVTLADVVADNKVESCDLLKLDCEGSEFDILNAPAEVVSKFRRIVGETHWFTKERLAEFVNRLERTHVVSFPAGYLFAEAKA